MAPKMTQNSLRDIEVRDPEEDREGTVQQNPAEVVAGLERILKGRSGECESDSEGLKMS